MPTWYFETGNPPFIENRNPESGFASAARNTLISFYLVDAESYVRISDLDAYVNGADAYRSGIGFVAPYNGPGSTINFLPGGSADGYDAYEVILDNTGLFSCGQTVTVRAVADDYGHNEVDESWSFSIRDAYSWYFDTGSIPTEIIFLAEYLNTSLFNTSLDLLINSFSRNPEICYNGANATTTIWDPYSAGNRLAILGSGSNVSINKETSLLGPNDLSVLFNKGKYFGDPLGNTKGDIEDECFVLNVLVKTPDYLESGVVASKGDSDGGWILRFTKHLQKLALSLYGASGSTTITTTELQPNTWYYITFYVEYDGLAYVFVDGKVNNSSNVSGIGSLTNSERLYLGSSNASNELAFICLWTMDAWFSFPANYSEIEDLEGQRFREIIATHPVIAGTYNPLTHERDSVAHLDKIESTTGYRRYYKVGENWLRTCRRYDSAGVATEDGLLIERGFFNQVENPERFDLWYDSNISVVSNASLAPDNSLTADRLVENSKRGRHFIQDNVAITASSSEFHVASVFAKALNRDWIVLEVRSSFNNIVRYCFFDVKNGVVGANSNIFQADVEDWKGGLYRCWFSWSAGALEEIIPWIPDKIRIYSASSNGSFVHIGNGSSAVDVAMAQVESDTCYPSNFTSANGVSDDFKVLDNLAYYASGNVYDGYGLLEAYGMIPEHNLATYERSFVSITDGQNKWKRIQVYMNPNGNNGEAIVINRINPLVVPVSESTDIVDGYEHKIAFDYEDNNYSIFVDDVAGTSGSAETVPTSVDRIAIGRSPNISVTPDTSDSLLIKRIKIRK